MMQVVGLKLLSSVRYKTNKNFSLGGRTILGMHQFQFQSIPIPILELELVGIDRNWLELTGIGIGIDRN
jgi:hypothetical protein